MKSSTPRIISETQSEQKDLHAGEKPSAATERETKALYESNKSIQEAILYS
ncbi:MAG TPA: hypothetical protein VHK24_01825 [Steroidobacter sp.]|nr:hypothetical protein [Steroidobacter sp.]